LKKKHLKTEKEKRFASIINLGCFKNLVEAEKFAFYLSENGYAFCNLFNSPDVDLVVINTCAFIKSARREALETIKKVLYLKNRGICKKVVITGCYAKMFHNKGAKKFPEVDFICIKEPIKEISNFLSIKREPANLFNRIPSTKFYSYLKIAEGCNRNCSFCLIPSIKGSLSSVPLDKLIDEARILSEEFEIKELIIIAQDTISYGKDLSYKSGLLRLLEKLSKIENLKWIRVMYLYPSVNKNLLKNLLSIEKVVSYIDVPLQHCSKKILKSMNRPTNVIDFAEDLVSLREDFENLSLRTTFIVGFPGEDESSFNELLRFLSKYKFDRAGFFKYSREKFTPAYGMPNQIDSKTKNERLKLAYQLQKRISDNIRKSFIGKKMDVIIEEISEDGYAFGRTERDAPEIDEGVIIKGNSELLKDKLGEIVKVKMIASKDYNLIGEIV